MTFKKVYMVQVQGITIWTKEHQVFKLQKMIYKLKCRIRTWYVKIYTFFVATRFDNDHNMDYNIETKKYFTPILNVNNLLLVGNN
jgi:GTP cyclohydrolase III